VLYAIGLYKALPRAVIRESWGSIILFADGKTKKDIEYRAGIACSAFPDFMTK
jgi:hypothetical protein